MIYTYKPKNKKMHLIPDVQRDFDYLSRVYIKLHRLLEQRDYDEIIIVQREHKDFIEMMESKYDMSIGKFTSIYERIINLKNKVEKIMTKH